MTSVALTTDHPAWTTTPGGTLARLMATDSGMWLASFTRPDGLTLNNVTGTDDTKPTTAITGADELPAGLPSHLGHPLAALGVVMRVPNPSLWDAINTAILRQVVRAAQARKVYRAWCQTHGTTLVTRGSHHRFEDDLGNVQRELDLYEQAIPILESMSVRVVRINTGSLTPEGAAAAILHAAGSPSVTVAPSDPVPEPG